jgi:hypothetical protein
VLRRLWVLLAAVVLLATAATATTAYAAKITLTSKSLYAMKASASPMPFQLVSDAFPVNGTLVGKSAFNGQPWSVVQGTLMVTNGRLQCTTCANGNYGAALVHADLAQVTASLTIRSNTGTGNMAGGIVMNANAAGTQAFAVWYDAGQVQLLRYVNGVATFVAAQNVAPPTNNLDVPLKVTYNAGTYTITFNGATLSYTLTAADQVTFGANTYFGIVIYDDPNVVGLDSFLVTQ